jgi:homoserine/homoserine lactone efflux protein
LVLSKDHASDVEANTSGNASRLVQAWVATSKANPFAVVFFVALFPQFIDPAAPVLPRLLLLGITYIVVDRVILLIWGWLGVRAAGALKRFSFGLANKICGGLMIAATEFLATPDPELQHRGFACGRSLKSVHFSFSFSRRLLR